MRKIIYLHILIWISVSCQLNKKENTTTTSTPLSFHDPKAGLSPDERYGVLFDSVQLSGIFPDSKTFVDCSPRIPTDSILAAYERNRANPGFDLKQFVNEYFVVPSDMLSAYKTDMGKNAASHINELWNVLSRQADSVDMGTKIPLPKPYVVPGGRFREIYYWDSYFTMLGLQASKRVDLIENMVDNFAYLIDTIGFIPNGNRTYYLGRSQPPFFAGMVQILAEEKGEQVYAKYLPVLEKEYKFWMDGKMETPGSEISSNKRVVNLDRNTLNRYRDDKNTPRPEGFKEDKTTAKLSVRPPDETYRHLRSGAESGWDYSSRWFEDGKTLATIHTTDIIPIDLNALLYNLEMVLLKANIVAKKPEEATKYESVASSRREALKRYCWNNEKGMFFDFDFQKYRTTAVPSLATMYPLYFKMVTKRDAEEVAKNIEKIFLRPGGVVTTPNNTGQQWDAPNGWAPLQWITIKGLRNYGHDSLADIIKKRWVDLNVKVYQKSGKMLEKYNVEDLSIESGGGEYPVQDGFGWTNGVLMKLLSEKK
jgi:alpha,alpha-trehalase